MYNKDKDEKIREGERGQKKWWSGVLLWIIAHSSILICSANVLTEPNGEINWQISTDKWANMKNGGQSWGYPCICTTPC